MMPDQFKCDRIEVNEVNDAISAVCELLICSASYEERSLSVPLNLSSDGPRSVMILKNANVAGKGSEHADRIVKHFPQAAEVFEITKFAAVRTADLLSDAIQKQLELGVSKICVDVTTMTHETLLIVFRLLNYLLKEDHHSVTYLYNPAAEYDPGTPQDKKWLSKGVSHVGSILGFSGDLLPSRKNHLVVLVGFEVNRASGLIDVFEPASMSFGYGDQSSFNEEHRRVNEKKHKRLSARYSNAEHFGFSPSDAYQVRDQILSHAQEHSDKNLIVAPMNTKISTLGCALAALANPRIQLCYASAVTYNSGNYSKPSEECLIFQC